MTRRRRHGFPLLALAALLACLALVAGACNDSGESGSSKESDSADAGSEGAESGDSDSGDSTEDSSGAESGEGDSGDAAGTRPGDNEAAIARLEAASTTCEVLESLNAVFSTEDPTTAEESKAFVDSYVLAFEKMAETTDDPELAGQLEAAAANIRKYSEDADYDPAVINPQVQPDYEGAVEDFAAAEKWSNAAVAQCMPDMPAVPTP